jgi:hypothetical protein
MRKSIFTVALIFSAFLAKAQVGIGTTTPSVSAALEINSTTGGILVPRMTSAQKGVIATPATGLLIYQTDGTVGFYYYDGSAWQTFAAGSGWGLSGSAGTSSATNKVGTTDAQDFKLVTNNTEAIRITSGGNVGIGTTAPSTKLHLVSSTPSSAVFNDGFEDNTVPPYTTGGSANWVTQNTTVNSGTWAARSGVIGNSVTSWIQSTATLGAQGGTISFAYSTSSESGWDKMYFYIDGVLQTSSWSGATAWTTATFNLTTGAHTFKWEYSKDSSGTSGADAVYLDDVTVTSFGLSPLEITDGTQANGNLLASDANGVASWKPASAISFNDDDWRWASGSSWSDPIYHTGKVKIGQSTASAYTLHVCNGAASGSDIGFGSVEYLTDDVAGIKCSHGFSLITDNSANLGSATNRWTSVWAVNGTIQTSDIRDKERIEPLKYGLDEILKLEPITFKWKEEKIDDFIVPSNEKETKLGFVAQQIQPILPEVIETAEWKEYEENPGVLVKKDMRRLGVSYSEIIPVAIKAIQEQQEQIEKLKKQKEELVRLISEFEKK